MGGQQTPALPQAAQPNPALQGYVGAAGNYLQGQVGQSLQPWPGPYAAPAVPEQQYGANYLQALAQEGASSDVSPTGLATIQNTAAGGQLGAADPYIQQIMQGMTQLSNTQLDRQISNLQAQYGAQGAGINSLAGQGIADLESSTNASLQTALGQLGLGAYNTGSAQQQAAAQFGANYEPAIATQAMQAGSALTGINQSALQAMMQEYSNIQQSPYLPLQYLSAAQPSSANYPLYPSSSTASIGSSLLGLLGQNLTGTALGSWLGVT